MNFELKINVKIVNLLIIIFFTFFFFIKTFLKFNGFDWLLPIISFPIVCFIPGFILYRTLHKDDDPIETILTAFSFSILLNLLLMSILLIFMFKLSFEVIAVIQIPLMIGLWFLDLKINEENLISFQLNQFSFFNSVEKWRVIPIILFFGGLITGFINLFDIVGPFFAVSAYRDSQVSYLPAIVFICIIATFFVISLKEIFSKNFDIRNSLKLKLSVLIIFLFGLLLRLAPSLSLNGFFSSDSTYHLGVIRKLILDGNVIDEGLPEVYQNITPFYFIGFHGFIAEFSILTGIDPILLMLFFPQILMYCIGFGFMFLLVEKLPPRTPRILILFFYATFPSLFFSQSYGTPFYFFAAFIPLLIFVFIKEDFRKTSVGLFTVIFLFFCSLLIHTLWFLFIGAIFFFFFIYQMVKYWQVNIQTKAFNKNQAFLFLFLIYLGFLIILGITSGFLIRIIISFSEKLFSLPKSYGLFLTNSRMESLAIYDIFEIIRDFPSIPSLLYMMFNILPIIISFSFSFMRIYKSENIDNDPLNKLCLLYLIEIGIYLSFIFTPKILTFMRFRETMIPLELIFLGIITIHFLFNCQVLEADFLKQFPFKRISIVRFLLVIFLIGALLSTYEPYTPYNSDEIALTSWINENTNQDNTTVFTDEPRAHYIFGYTLRGTNTYGWHLILQPSQSNISFLKQYYCLSTECYVLIEDVVNYQPVEKYDFDLCYSILANSSYFNLVFSRDERLYLFEIL